MHSEKLISPKQNRYSIHVKENFSPKIGTIYQSSASRQTSCALHTHASSRSYVTSIISLLGLTWSTSPEKGPLSGGSPPPPPNPHWSIFIFSLFSVHYLLNNLQTYQYYEIQTAKNSFVQNKIDTLSTWSKIFIVLKIRRMNQSTFPQNLMHTLHACAI